MFSGRLFLGIEGETIMRERVSFMTFAVEMDIAMGKMTIKEALETVKNEGINYVDVMTLNDKRLEVYQEAFEATGIKPYAYIGRVSFFSNSDEKIRELLKNEIEMTKKLGVEIFMLVPINPQKDEKICTKMGEEKVKETLVKYCTFAVSVAKDMGITVCVETTPQDYSCLSGADDCKDVLDKVDGLGLIFDTGNCLAHGDDPLEYYEKLKKYIVHVHLKDILLEKPTLRDKIIPGEKAKDGQAMRCCVSGQGIIPLKEIVTRMERDGYNGKYALEYSHPKKYPANREQNALRLKEHMKFFEDFE